MPQKISLLRRSRVLLATGSISAGSIWLGALGAFGAQMEEDFSPATLGAWSSSAGDWQVADDEPSRVVSPGELSILAGGKSDWQNYAVSTRFRLEAGRTAGLVFRYQDPENYYACVFTPMDEEYTETQDRRNEFILGEGQIRFIRVLEGEKHYLVNYPYPLESGQWVDVKVEITGPEMTAYVNGEYMLYTEHIELPAGGVGLYSGADSVVSFSGVSVSPLEAPGPDPALADFTPNAHRQGSLLNGMWDFSAEDIEPRKMRVPDAFGRVSAVPNNHPEVIYERTFDVPADFGPVVMLEFEGVVDFCDVFVNDEKVGTHRGEHVAFAYDVSDHVQIPSTGNTLKVVVRTGGEEWNYWPRGLRYSRFDDSRAYRMTPIMAERNKAYRKFDAAYEMAKRGMSRVLVCDKAYDALGRKPEPPLLRPGTKIQRTLIVFNDDYQDGEEVLVEWEARTPDAVADSGSFTVTLEKGAHTERNITFETPEAADGTPLQLVVKASKNGVPKYLDDQWYQFQIGKNGHGATVVMGGGTPASGDVPEGYDNTWTLLTYSGNWRHEQDAQYLGNTKSISDSAGASVSFDFEGSKLAVYAKTGAGLGSFRIFIDGELRETVSTQGADAYGQVVYEIEGMDATSHSVRLEVVGDGWVGLDYFGLDL